MVLSDIGLEDTASGFRPAVRERDGMALSGR
jgi:hypothetical protein